MGCWRESKGVSKEAGIEITDENREKIEEAIQKVIGETSKYGSCSNDWRKAGKELKTDENARAGNFIT